MPSPFPCGAPVFVHLHCHSHYSFLRGVGSPEEIVAAAVEQKMPAVALTDANGLYAAVSFYQAAKKAGIHPIVGVVLDVEFYVSSEPFRNCKSKTRHSSSAPLTLLAADMEGYSNLCQLVTLRHLGTTKPSQNIRSPETDGRPVTFEELAEHNRGVIALAPANHLQLISFASLRMTNEKKRAGGASPAPTKTTQGDDHCQEQGISSTSQESPIATHFSQLKEIFGDRLYIEVQHLSPGDGQTLREAERLGHELGVPLVATNNVHFLRPEEHLHHRTVNAIRTGGLLTTVAPPEITTGKAWFKPVAEMQKLFPDHPELLRATLEIAERCNLQLELGKLIFPEFTVPEGHTPDSYLQKLSLTGALKRYHSFTPEVRSRLMRELEVIKKWGLAPYFLLVLEIVEEARRRGIPAVARGSAASSMVTYCLGISPVCPSRWGLYFERFLNEQRGDCPDIDLDLCGARRDELLDYVYKRWGAEHVAMIASFITMHARLAVREVAKVFGLSPGEVDHFTRRLPHRPVREILEAIRTLPECRALPAQEEPWKTILEVALRLDDFPRHLGIHPCGTVISAQPLTRLVPLEVATKGIVVTQYDMNAVEALGLIKMDLLGQRGLTTMSLALEEIERASGKPLGEAQGKRVDFDTIPEADPATCAMISQGRTMGVFQIESPGMRGLLRTLEARALDDIAVALALIRPGASEYGAKETFLKRLRKQEPVRYAHSCLKAILGETLGVCVYQEQVMQI